MLTAIIPNPYGAGCFARHEIHGDDSRQLARSVREFLTYEGYGASNVGSQFNVYEDGKQVGLMSFNGKYSEEF